MTRGKILQICGLFKVLMRKLITSGIHCPPERCLSRRLSIGGYSRCHYRTPTISVLYHE